MNDRFRAPVYPSTSSDTSHDDDDPSLGTSFDSADIYGQSLGTRVGNAMAHPSVVNVIE